MDVTLVTSQCGSAWHCYIGRLNYKRKMRFSTSRPGKTNEYFVTKLSKRDNVDLYTHQIWCRSVAKWRLHGVVKYNGFDFLLPPFFVFFLGQPIGRNFGPNCTLNGSKIVFLLIHVPFAGLVPAFKFIMRGSPVQKPLNFDPYVWKIQDGGRRHLGLRKTAAIFLLFDRSSPTFVKTLGQQFGTYRWRQKCKVSKIQDGGRRHLRFRKTVAISLLTDRSSSHLVGKLLLI